MARKKLPITIQTFSKIRKGGEDDYYYVDKTPFIARLIDAGAVHHFLSRPRRFGKSMLVDTLKNLFGGKEELFRGLYIHDKWDWTKEHPVLHFKFAGGNFKQPGELQKKLLEQLTDLEDEFEVKTKHETASGRLAYLIERLAREKGQPVVILVDEYDKPIFDALGTPELSRDNRDTLSGFYGTLKDCEEDIQFSFLTGVSKFAHAGIFSGLNNLVDISLEPEFSSICGYTDQDIDTVFEPEIRELDREEIKEWYNGYSWRGPEKVYNPFSILQLFRKREFEDWWFRTGTPTFLIEVLKKRRTGTLGLARMSESGELMSSIDIGSIKTPALLFQTGYLTIIDENRKKKETLYQLDFPNHEVRKGLHEKLLDALTPEAESGGQPTRLREALVSGDFDVVREILQARFSGFPRDSYRKNAIADYEGYYSNVIHTCLDWTGLSVHAENPTSKGRIDLTVDAGTRICIFEFKVLRKGVTPDGALQQIHDRGYADKYLGHGVPIHLVGVEFDPEERNIENFEHETIQPASGRAKHTRKKSSRKKRTRKKSTRKNTRKGARKKRARKNTRKGARKKRARKNTRKGARKKRARKNTRKKPVRKKSAQKSVRKKSTRKKRSPRR